MPLSDFLAGHKGEAAALATAVCWSLTPFFFTAASRRIGAFSANVIRLYIANLLLFLAVLSLGAFEWIPWRQCLLLAGSGFVGLTLGDAALFEAFVLLGPRRVSLLSATAPIFVALLSMPLLGERLSAVGIVGMAMTLGGVAWVVLERGGEADVGGHVPRGVLMGLLAAAGQAGGFLLAKGGLGTADTHSTFGRFAAPEGAAWSVGPLLGTLIRMTAGCGGMLLYAALTRRVGEVTRGVRDRRGLAQTAGGAVFGPFIGVWLSLCAAKWTRQAAVAQTIMAFSPVLVIVIATFVHGERPSVRAWIGSFVAVLGLVALGLREEIARLVT